MSRIGLYTDREILGAGLRQTLNPFHSLEMLSLDDVGGLSSSSSVAAYPETEDHAWFRLHALILDAPPEQSFLIPHLRGEAAEVPLIVWERVSRSEPALNALGSGVQGIILDSSSSADVLTCVRTVLDGGIWVPPSIAQAVVSSRSCHLTKREGQLIHLVAQGLSNKEISTALGISVGTVKVYFSRLFTKVNVSDRYELAILGLRQSGGISQGASALICSAESHPISQTVFLPRTQELHKSTSWHKFENYSSPVSQKRHYVVKQ